MVAQRGSRVPQRDPTLRDALISRWQVSGQQEDGGSLFTVEWIRHFLTLYIGCLKHFFDTIQWSAVALLPALLPTHLPASLCAEGFALVSP